MEEITNHNCVGLCSQKYCDDSETHFTILEVGNFFFISTFCKKHAEEFEDKLFESKFEGEENA